MAESALTVQRVEPSEFRPPTEEELAQMTPGQRMLLAEALQAMYERGLAPDGSRLAKVVGPQTDEDLLIAVEEVTGYRIPRNAVCLEHGHTSPAETFCDLYFNRIFNVLWIGNRGGGKTANSGFLHGAKCRYNDEYESAIAGAVEKQGYRAYAEFKRYTRRLGVEVLNSMLSKTEWANGAQTEVLGGTVKQLNGPHPHLAQMDEVELTTPEPFEEFLNMAQGDDRYPAQQLLTSTRKKAFGIVQGIVTEVDEAIKQGGEPPWIVRIFCIFETMQRTSNCRSAPENAGRPEEELCDCNKVIKGTWDDGTIRRFDQVCGGRAYRADGFVHLTDAQKRFRQLSRMTWEAQQECLRPSIEGVVHKWYTPRHYLPTWLPHAEFGPIYRGWDWGGQNPNAVVWVQELQAPVGLNKDGLPILEGEEEAVMVLEPGTLVQFDEVYKTADELPGDGGFSDLAQFVADREQEWRTFGYEMKIEFEFCDPSGFVAKREVKKKFRELIERGEHPGLELPNWKSIAAPVYESVLLHQSWGESGKIKVVVGMCINTDEEYGVYHWPDKKDGKNRSEVPVKEDDHAMDAMRYLIWNLDRMRAKKGAEDQPAGEARGTPASTTPDASPFAGPRTAPPPTPVGSPVGAAPAGGRGSRMRERPVPGVRGLAGPGGVR